MRKKPPWRHPLLWMLVVFFALTTATGMILPSLEAIDEPEHYNLIRYLADGNGLPDQRDRLFGHTLKVKGQDQPPGIVTVVPDGDIVARDLVSKALFQLAQITIAH